MLTERDITSVLIAYGIRPELAGRIEPVAGGWSGSQLWKITAADGRELGLRCWPAEHPSEERLLFIHRVLIEVAKSLPIVACPLPSAAGATFVRHAERLWELTPWMPGRPEDRHPPSEAKLRAALQALARFHGAAANVQTALDIAPSWTDRHQQAEALRRGGMEQITTALLQPLDAALDPMARRLLPLARRALDRLTGDALMSGPPELALLPAIRDIHREHVLFTGDEVTGLIDFGALRVDTPLADVSRLIGSLAGSNREVRRLALHTYAELRPLSAEDRRLIDFFDESGLVLAAFNWLRWLYVERRDMGPPEPIVRRLTEIEARLSAILALAIR